MLTIEQTSIPRVVGTKKSGSGWLIFFVVLLVLGAVAYFLHEEYNIFGIAKKTAEKQFLSNYTDNLTPEDYDKINEAFND